VCQVVLSQPAAAPRVEGLLLAALDEQLESGNLPASLPSASDKLVQFCHGSPGMVLSLRSLRPYFPAIHDQIDRAMERAQADVWARGVLRKDSCLCHGVAGNALALDDDKQFAVFLSCMATDSMEKLGLMKARGRSDEFASLYTGEAGRAWVWAIADKGLPRTCIGYNDL
jgi:hypothetical protein